MKIQVHVERLTVDGQLTSTGDRALIGEALVQELTRLLAASAATERLPHFLLQCAALESLAVPLIVSPANATARVLGAGIARSVHKGFDLHGDASRDTTANTSLGVYHGTPTQAVAGTESSR